MAKICEWLLMLPLWIEGDPGHEEIHPDETVCRLNGKTDCEGELAKCKFATEIRWARAAQMNQKPGRITQKITQKE